MASRLVGRMVRPILRVRARITSGNWRPDLGQIGPIRGSKTGGVAAATLRILRAWSGPRWPVAAMPKPEVILARTLRAATSLLALVAGLVACGAGEVREAGSGVEERGATDADGPVPGERRTGAAVQPEARISARFEAECGRRDPARTEATRERDQYTAGLAVFSERCASCHGGSGSFAGALSGDVLRRYRTGFGLYDYIRLNMPYYDAGTLTSQEYWDITAFLLVSTGLAERDVRVGCGGLPDVVLAPGG